MFEIRNRMTNIPGNYGNQKEFECGEIENMEHIYKCKYLNGNEILVEYENINKENVRNVKTILNRFEKNMKKREDKLGLSCAKLKSSFARHKPETTSFDTWGWGGGAKYLI